MTDQPTITDDVLHDACTAYEGPDYIGDPYDHEGIRRAIETAAPHIAAQVLRDAADLVDRGPTFPMPPSIISALLRERADDLAKGADGA